MRLASSGVEELYLSGEVTTMTKRLFLSLSLLFLSHPLAAATVTGNGAQSCGNFIGYINTDDKAGVDGFISWAQGFIAGVNWLDGRDIHIDAGGLTYALVNECGNTPGKPFYQAVIAVVSHYR